MKIMSITLNNKVNENIKKKSITLLSLSMIFTAFFNFTAVAESTKDVAQLAKQCVACHGEKGVSANDSWPNLAGQQTRYLVNQITAFRDGTRKSPLMQPVVNNLTDQQIKQLAQYFSAQVNDYKGEAKQNMEGKRVRARCISCHGMQGFTVADVWPNLAGQKKSYLEKQLMSFKNGQRKSPIMEVIASELNNEQIKNVAEYFSQQPAGKK